MSIIRNRNLEYTRAIRNVSINTDTPKGQERDQFPKTLPLLFAVVLFVSLMDIEGPIQFIFLLLFCIYLWASGVGYRLNGIQKFAMAGIFILCGNVLIQAIFSISNVSLQYSLGFALKLCSGFLIAIPLSRNPKAGEICVKTFLLFAIMFAFADFFLEVSNGLSTARNSALGYASKNYFASCLYFSMPVLLFNVFERDDRIIRSLSIIACVGIVAAILVSGSKTAALCLFSILVIELFSTLKDVRVLVLVVFLLLCTCILISLIIVNNDTIREIVSRGTSIITGTGDDSNRNFLYEVAISSYEDLSLAEKLFGIGEIDLSVISAIIGARVFIPPHNLVAELLLSTGIIGLVSFAFCYGGIAFNCFRNAMTTAIPYLLMIAACFIITAWTQPFFSTSFTCGLIAMSSMLALSFERN